MKRFITFLLALLLTLAPVSALADPPDVEEELTEALLEDGTLNPSALDCGGAILVDARTGEVLFEKNADQQYFPASITKIMTCLLVLEYVEEHPEVLDSTITIEKTYYLEENAAHIGTKIGEEFNFKDLLYGLMLASGNEIGIILGEEIAGDLETFIGMMNSRAQELGMVNTHYNNPHGLNDPTHLTTARDQAKLAVEAMKNELFREIVATDVYTCPETNKSDARRWSNHNKLMLGNTTDDSQSYDKAIGIKTGYTSKAKCTLVSAAHEEETGEEYIAVCMFGTNTEARFHSCRVMLEYGFTAFDQTDAALYLDLFSAKDMEVAGAAPGQLLSYTLQGESMPMTLSTEEMQSVKDNPTDHFSVTVHLDPELAAPIKMGDKVGTFDYYFGDTYLGQGELIASSDVAAPAPTPTAAPSIFGGGSQTDKDGEQDSAISEKPSAKKDLFKTVAVILLIVMALLIVAILIVIILRLRGASAPADYEPRDPARAASRSSRRERRRAAEGTPRSSSASSRRRR